jgi:hypothetical protein
MEIQITDHSVIVVKKNNEDTRDQISFFNLISEFYVKQKEMGRVEIAQHFMYDLLLFVKDGEYDNYEIQNAEYADYVDLPDGKSVLVPSAVGDYSPPIGNLPDKVFG